jgi:hypothetical protein
MHFRTAVHRALPQPAFATTTSTDCEQKLRSKARTPFKLAPRPSFGLSEIISRLFCYFDVLSAVAEIPVALTQTPWPQKLSPWEKRVTPGSIIDHVPRLHLEAEWSLFTLNVKVWKLPMVNVHKQE